MWVCGGVLGEMWCILHKVSYNWKRHSLDSEGALGRNIDPQSMLEFAFCFLTFVTH